MTQPQLYFKTVGDWRNWLDKNHQKYTGVFLIFYKVSSNKPSMRWEEAVKVALCYGWIDSKVKRLDEEKRLQYFSRRKHKSVWSKINKATIKKLSEEHLMHKSGLNIVEIAKNNGSWDSLNDIDNEIIPADLQRSFNTNQEAYKNYQSFAPSYRRGYLYWLHSAKREATRNQRIVEIIRLCKANIKQPSQ